LLIEAGANVDAATQIGWTPLMSAALNGNAGIAKLLIESGAAVEIVSSGGQNALALASLCGSDDCVNLFLISGADPKRVPDFMGYSALLIAVCKCSLETVVSMLDHGADAKHTAYDGMTAVLLAQKYERSDITTLLEPIA
jgi:ankyrin repeat protein